MLNKKTKYALQALIVLGGTNSDSPMLISSISEQANIPKKFLEQILLELKNGGILDSRKGQGGGYFLKKEPSKITLGQVIRITSGAVALVSCVSKTAYAPCPECPDEASCGIKAVMEDVHGVTTAILDTRSLADILSESERRKATQKMYHI